MKRRRRQKPRELYSSGPPPSEIARMKAEMALVDSLPPEARRAVWDQGFGILGVDATMVRRKAAEVAREGREGRSRADRYVAPVIGRF
jgi:hypothetical protein